MDSGNSQKQMEAGGDAFASCEKGLSAEKK